MESLPPGSAGKPRLMWSGPGLKGPFLTRSWSWILFWHDRGLWSLFPQELLHKFWVGEWVDNGWI
jgi:hypothetical protein